MLKTQSRWLPLTLLSILSCATAAAQPVQQMAGDWPRQIDADGATIVIYEPQLETFRGSRMTSRAAVSLTRENSSEPVFGGIWLDAVLSTDTDRRTVTPVLLKVTELRFPGISSAEAARLRLDIGDEISSWKLTYSVDTLLAEVRLLEEQRAAAEGLKAEVPQILFRNSPAVLLALEDEPAWNNSSDSAFQRLANSPAFVVRESTSGTHYLRIGAFWWTSTNPLGAWQAAENVPDAVADVWKNDVSQPAAESGPRPEVVAVSGAAELVWTDGAPQYAPIAGTDLLYIQNTDSDVFLDIRSQTRYALFSGRWYRSPQARDTWEFVASDKLPADFGRIPITSEKRHVLACVAGTPQAQEALKNAEIPQTEAVKTGPAPDLQATYDGEPQFTEVSNIGVQYAVNTPYSIFRVPGRYYWCYDGIWYDSAFAVGPWYVCVGVPRVIYLIPPSCPHYYVTYCHVFGVSSDAVYVGYYPGYRGCYAWGGSVVYGTGYHYRPWYGNQCYTRPVTWGLGVRYSSSNCGWSVSVGIGVTSTWGPRRPSGYRAPPLQAGAGGYWGGGVHGYRNPPPSSSHARPNLYDRQPDRRAPNPARPHRDMTPLPPPRQDPDRAPRGPHTGPKDPPSVRPLPPREPRDPQDRPKDPPAPRPEHPRTPLPPPQRDPHERPKDPSAEREKPHAPPPSRDPRDGPKDPPSPKPETPRTPPPPREHPEVPRTPPPPRETPKPPPPSRENRESPRTPPPPRDVPRTPPPPRQDREAPRTPPPQREQREAPRTPPPQREPRETPRKQEPPPRREPKQKDAPRSSDRKR